MIALLNALKPSTARPADTLTWLTGRVAEPSNKISSPLDEGADYAGAIEAGYAQRRTERQASGQSLERLPDCTEFFAQKAKLRLIAKVASAPDANSITFQFASDRRITMNGTNSLSTKSVTVAGVAATLVLALTVVALSPAPARAVVYCQYVEYPAGCVARAGVVLRPRPVARAAVRHNAGGNLNGGVNRVGVRR